MAHPDWRVAIDDPELRLQALRSLGFRLSRYGSVLRTVSLGCTPQAGGLWCARATCESSNGSWRIEDIRGDAEAAVSAVIQRIESRARLAERRMAVLDPGAVVAVSGRR